MPAFPISKRVLRKPLGLGWSWIFLCVKKREPSEQTSKTIFRMLPAYIPYEINEGKKKMLLATIDKAVELYGVHVKCHLRHLYETGDVEFLPNASNYPNNGMLQMWVQDIAFQTRNPVRLWRIEIDGEVLRILKSRFSGNEYRLLARLVKFKHNFGPIRPTEFRREDIGATDESVEEAYRLVLDVTRHVRKHRRPPGSIGKYGWLNLSKNYCATLDLKSGLSTGAVLIVSTLKKRHRVSVPISIPEYTKNRGLVPTGAVQIHRTPDDKIEVKIAAEGKGKPIELVPDLKVGIDVGAAVPIATSDGDLLGRNFWQHIQKMDAKLAKCWKGVKTRGKTQYSHRYNKLQRQLSGYVKNEIRRMLKGYIHRVRPSVIVVEDLEDRVFANTKGFGGKRLRRLLQRVGRREFKLALNQYCEEYGIELVYVNPCYTSKGCECGYYGNDARPNQKTFHCPKCHRKGNADVHAAKRILSRCSVQGLSRSPQEPNWYSGGRKAAQEYQARLAAEHLHFCGEHWRKAGVQAPAEILGGVAEASLRAMTSVT